MFPLCLAASLSVILSVRLSVIPSNQFPWLFFVVLGDIDLKCDMNLPFMVKQKNFGFCRVWTNLVWVIHCVPRAPVREVSSRLYLFAFCSNAYIFTFHTLFSLFTQRKRHCCYNIITTISHVISSEGIHGTEKYVWSGLLLLMKMPEIHLNSHFKVSDWT